MFILFSGFVVLGLGSSLLFVLGGMVAARSDARDVQYFGARLSSEI